MKVRRPNSACRSNSAFADQTQRFQSELGVWTPNVKVRRPNSVFAEQTLSVCIPIVRVHRPNVSVHRPNSVFADRTQRLDCEH